MVTVQKGTSIRLRETGGETQGASHHKGSEMRVVCVCSVRALRWRLGKGPEGPKQTGDEGHLVSVSAPLSKHGAVCTSLWGGLNGGEALLPDLRGLVPSLAG